LLIDRSVPKRLRKALYLFKLLEEASKALTEDDMEYLKKLAEVDEKE